MPHGHVLCAMACHQSHVPWPCPLYYGPVQRPKTNQNVLWGDPDPKFLIKGFPNHVLGCIEHMVLEDKGDEAEPEAVAEQKPEDDDLAPQLLGRPPTAGQTPNYYRAVRNTDGARGPPVFCTLGPASILHFGAPPVYSNLGPARFLK